MNTKLIQDIPLKSIKPLHKQQKQPKKTIWSPNKHSNMSNAMYKALLLVKEFMSQSNKAQIFLKEGKNALEENDYLGAIECFNEGISCNPSIVSFYILRALCHKSQNLFKLAYFDYSFAIRLESDHGSHYCLRGLCLAKLKKYDMALEDLDLSCQLDPSAFHYYSRGTVLADSLKFDSAIKDYTKAIDIDTSNNISLTELRLKCLYRRAQTYIDLNLYKNAIDDLTIVLTGDSTSVNALLMLGRAHKLLCEYKRADECVSNSILLDPTQPAFFAERGDVRYRTGRPNQIIESIYDFDKAVFLYEKRISSLLLHRDGHVNKSTSPKQHRNSITFTLNHQSLPQIGIHTHINHSHDINTSVNMHIFDPKTTHHDLYETIYGLQEIEENLADVLNKRAQAKLLLDTNTQLIEEALVDSRRALVIVPNDINYSLVVSTCYIRLKQFDQAIEIIQQVLEKSPNNEKALFQYSFCLREVGSRKNAIEELTKIITYSDKGLINPLVIPIHRVYETRGTLLHEIQAHKLALADIGKAVSLNPERPENLYLRADCHAKLGNYEQAINDYNYAESKGFPDLYTLYTSRGMVHRLRGRSDEAIIDFDKALGLLDSKNSLNHDPLQMNRVRIHTMQSLCMIDQKLYYDAYDTLQLAKELIDKAMNIVSSNDESFNYNQLSFDLTSLKKLDWLLSYHTALTTYMVGNYMETIELLTYCIDNAYDIITSDSELDSNNSTDNTVGSSKANSNRVCYCPDSYTFGIVTYFLALSYYRTNQSESLKQSNIFYDMTFDTTWFNINSNKILLYFSLGKLKQKLTDYEPSIHLFTQAISLDQSNAYIYFRRGWSYKALRQYRLAGSDFEIAKNIEINNPNFSIDYKNIGMIDYIEIDNEPDFIEQFPVLLPIPGQF